MFTLHVISHTHWDREWYFTFQQYRVRLVHLIDKLLTIMREDPDYRYFLLDGQTVVLEDYLEIKPHRKEHLQRLIGERRILIGPWYVLPDEFLVSGEALIRNLLLGDALCREFGGKMRIGYLPDLFGHISQMPQILRGFGFEDAVIWRGVSGDELPSELRWRAPDGSEVFTLHLPEAYGYANGEGFPTDVDEAEKRARERVTELQTRATTSHLLLMNGVDHQEPEPAIPGLLRELSKRIPEVAFVHDTLPGYIAAVRAEVPPALHLRVGEQRQTNWSSQGRFNFVLPNVLSSRIYLKQMNHTAQTTLEKWAEPFSVCAMIEGEDYLHDLLWQSWRYLLQNHPHDSICGCSIDAVHRQMVIRFEWAQEIADQVRDEALDGIIGRVGTTRLPEGEIPVHIFNPLPWSSTELIEMVVDCPVDAPVRGIIVTNQEGRRVLARLIEVCPVDRMPNRRGLWPPRQAYRASAARILVTVKDVPPVGYTTYRVKWTAQPGSPAVPAMLRGAAVVENPHLRLTLHPNGTFDLLHKASQRLFSGLHYFEDGGDVGDGYTYSPPREDRVITTLGEGARIELIEASEVATIYSVEYDLRLPLAIDPSGRRRSDETVVCPVRSEIILGAEAERVDIVTTVENRAKDHRLRVIFPTGILTDESTAEQAFDVVKRPIHVPQPPREVWIEDEPTTFPQKAFVDLSDGTAGLALINEGLPEYEVFDRSDRVVAITLLRAVGYLGAGDRPLTIRSGAGPHFATPESQCEGVYTFRYAVYPHEGGWEAGRVYQAAYGHTIPPRPVQGRRQEGHLPLTHSFFSMEPSSLILSALKRARDRETTIVRVFNPTEWTIQGRFTCDRPVREAYLTDLSEERDGAIPSAGAHVQLEIAPKKIVTLEIVV